MVIHIMCEMYWISSRLYSEVWVVAVSNVAENCSAWLGAHSFGWICHQNFQEAIYWRFYFRLRFVSIEQALMKLYPSFFPIYKVFENKSPTSADSLIRTTELRYKCVFHVCRNKKKVNDPDTFINWFLQRKWQKREKCYFVSGKTNLCVSFSQKITIICSGSNLATGW